VGQQWSVPPLTSVVRFTVTDVHDGTWRFLGRLPPSPWLGGDVSLSQVPGEPQCAHAPLLDPAGISPPCHYGSSMLPSVAIKTSAPEFGYFVALSRGLFTRCLRFVMRVATTSRKTRFRLMASLCRVGATPTGFLRNSFTTTSYG